jgi:cytochrome P450
MRLAQQSATAVFGTPVSEIERATVDVAFHVDLLQKPSAFLLADAMQRRITGDPSVRRPLEDPPNLRRNAFDLAPELAEIRATKGVDMVPTAFGAKTYVVTRFDDVKSMLIDYKRFSNTPPWLVSGARSPSAQEQEDPQAGNLMALDPAEHTRLRRMLSRGFNAQRVAGWEQHIVDVVDGRLAEMERVGGPVDLLRIYALPISSLVICEILGVPYENREDFLRRAVRGTEFTTGSDERAVIESESRAYMSTLVEHARLHPDKGILGMLVRHYGSELTDAELVGIGHLLLVAGHETTATMITMGTLALLRHPDQLALVREDPEAVGPAVEELLRWLTIIQTGQVRFTTTDVTLAGVTIPAREPVYASMPAANRDPAFIDNPESFDIRRGVPGHLAFGAGVHKCLGAPLARLQMRIAIPSLLRRFPDLALAEPFEQVPFRTSNFIYGLNSLQVTW